MSFSEVRNLIEARALDQAFAVLQAWLDDHGGAEFSIGHDVRLVKVAGSCGAADSAATELSVEQCEVQALLALLACHQGQVLEAQQRLQACLHHRQVLAPEVLTDLAGCFCWLGQAEEALALVNSALEKDPYLALALARQGWCYWQLGRWQAALVSYQRSLAIQPQRLQAWTALVSLNLLEQNTEAAQQALDDAIHLLQQQYEQMPIARVQPVLVQLRGLQLEIWLAQQQVETAEAWLEARRADIPEPEWLPLVSGFARLLVANNRFVEAEEQLRRGLKAYPNALSLAAQLADLMHQSGRSQQAIPVLRRAITIAERESLFCGGLWLQLGRTCLHGWPEQARKAAEQALAVAEAGSCAADENTDWGAASSKPLMRAPLYWQARNLLALVDSQQKAFDAAETGFKDVLAAHPHYIPALQGLGQQYMQLGRLDDAIGLFERVRDLDPATGYAALISARQFPEDATTLERLQQLAHRPGMESQVRSGLLFQLASAWEKRKDYGRAFELARSANDTSKQHLAYDPVVHRQQCARIRYAFSRSLYEHRGGYGSDSRLPVFVLGMPRSGTTLVEQILAGHPKIFGAGELGVIPQRIQGLNRWERHVGSGRRYPDVVDDLTPYVVNGIADGILAELRELAADDKPDALHVIDKLPHNFENVGLIKFLFPQARIISVRRDPRDIAISNYFTDYQAKHGGMGFAYDLTWIGEQLADHNLMMQHWNQLFPGEILEVQYEQLLDDPEAQTRRMLEYIGVEWEPQVLNFAGLERPVKTASVWQVRQPIYKTSKARWKRYEPWLAPLLKGTNARIKWSPIHMISLPLPGFLSDGVALYRDGKLDEAELSFRKMLHHNPEHLACQYLLGLVCCRKGHLQEGVERMRSAVAGAPWQTDWQENLATALTLLGEGDEAQRLRAGLLRRRSVNAEPGTTTRHDDGVGGIAFEGLLALTDSGYPVMGGN